MDVSSISVEKAQEIEEASIVNGYVNSSGHLVLVNGAGAEFNAGSLNLEHIEGKIFASNAMSAAATTVGGLYRIPTYDTLPAEDDYFKYWSNGITVKNPGYYDFHAELAPVTSVAADILAYGIRVSKGSGAGDVMDGMPRIVAPVTTGSLVNTRVDVRFIQNVDVANTRFYVDFFINKSNTNAYGAWYSMFRVSPAGSIATP